LGVGCPITGLPPQPCGEPATGPFHEGNDSGRLTHGDIMGLRMGTNQLHIDDKVVPCGALQF